MQKSYVFFYHPVYFVSFQREMYGKFEVDIYKTSVIKATIVFMRVYFAAHSQSSVYVLFIS